jgi:streptogramin lyase
VKPNFALPAILSCRQSVTRRIDPPAAALFFSCLVLAGCSGMPQMTSTKTPSSTAPGATISGRVHGGQNPISGAHVYLFAVNNTGYAGPGIAASSNNQAKSLLTSGDGTDSLGTYVLTGSDGSFTITGDYTCPTATPDTYLLSVGGNPGGSGSNSAIVLFAGLTDKCTVAGFTNLYAVVNEVSTVAAAFAGAGFATDPTHVSTSSTALAMRGVDDAYAGLVNLETLSTGIAVSTTPNGNGTAPQAEINTLANILAACVNSTGPTSTECTTLFDNAKNGSNVPTDTGTAILNIAHNPGANIANLYSLQTANSPFQPDWSGTPNDFSIAISYTGGGLDGPYGIAINAQDDILVTNISGDSVSVFDYLGVPLISSPGVTGNGLSEPYGIAVDGNGYVWVADYGVSALSSFAPTGAAVTHTSTGGLNTPEYIAIDASNNVWVDSLSNALSEFTNSSGVPTAVAGSPFGSGVLDSPFGIAIDAGGNVWLANRSGTPELVEYNSSASSHSTYTGGGLGGATNIAFDPSGNLWISDTNNSANSYALSEFNSSGAAVTGSGGYPGGGLNNPFGIAIDSNGSVFVANHGGGGISEFNSSGAAISPSNGFGSEGSNVGDPYSLAIDGSGNLWVTAFGGGAGNNIVEYVGIAAPVVTPIVANLQGSYAANHSAVNRP